MSAGAAGAVALAPEPEAAAAAPVPLELADAPPDDVVAVQAVMGRRGPPPSVTRGPGTIRAVRDGATAIIGPDGVYASRRNPDGTVSTAITRNPPPPDDDPDDE